jgi:hypothetical protein
VFKDHENNQFQKKWITIMIQNLHSYHITTITQPVTGPYTDNDSFLGKWIRAKPVRVYFFPWCTRPCGGERCKDSHDPAYHALSSQPAQKLPGGESQVCVHTIWLAYLASLHKAHAEATTLRLGVWGRDEARSNSTNSKSFHNLVHFVGFDNSLGFKHFVESESEIRDASQ